MCCTSSHLFIDAFLSRTLLRGLHATCADARRGRTEAGACACERGAGYLRSRWELCKQEMFLPCGAEVLELLRWSSLVHPIIGTILTLRSRLTFARPHHSLLLHRHPSSLALNRCSSAHQPSRSELQRRKHIRAVLESSQYGCSTGSA